MKKLNQTGFAAVEAVLILVVVGILGFTGWFVWHAKQNSDKSLAAANKSAASQSLSTNDPTGKWLTVNSAQGAFSVQVPDGWVGYNYGGADQFRFADIAQKAGTKPSVTNVAIPYAGDSEVPLSVELHHDAGPFTALLADAKISDFKLGSYDGTKYYKYYSESTPQGVGARNKGDADYAYQIDISNNEKLYVYYSVKAGDTDQDKLIETFISGIKLN